MKKLIVILAIVLMTSGCSTLIPRITMDTPNTVPQATEKSKAKYKCSGKIEYFEDGAVKSCSKGYYAYDEAYNKKERRMTIVERFKSFINGLVGASFWIFVALIVFAPSLIGFVIGKLVEGTIGITGATLKATARAIKRAKNNGGNFMEELDRAHSADTKIKKKINQVRAKIDG